MEGLIHNYRRSRTRQNNKHMIIGVEGSDNREKATKLVGKKIVYTTESGKKIVGEIRAAHGNNGCVRAIMLDRGLPGQSVGKKEEVM